MQYDNLKDLEESLKTRGERRADNKDFI